jgi:hypothetical protein
MTIKATPVEINWHKSQPIFSSEGFLRSISNEYGWIGGRAANGDLHCVLPYYIVRKAGLCVVRFTSETMWMDSELSVDQEKQFLNSTVDYFRTTKADLVIPATFNSLFRTYPDGALAAPYGTYIIDLTQPEETLWNNLHQKHRNVIRNAINKAVKIRHGTENLMTAEKLVRGSFDRSSRGILNRMRLHIRMTDNALISQTLSLKDHAVVFLAEFNGITQGSAIIPYSDHCAYYMHGGTIAHPVSGAMNLLQWEAIKHFRTLGVRNYNFVGTRIGPEPGSKQAGLAMFKQRFGGTLKRGYMWKYSYNSKKNWLYSIMAKIRNDGDIVDQEMHKLGKV